MSKFVDDLKVQAKENPLLAITTGFTVLAITTQFIKEIGGIWGRRTWAKEVARRTANTPK